MGKRLAELVYLVPEDRERYLEHHLHPSKEEKELLWLHGVRNQNYYVMNEFVLIVFDYVGKDLHKDMEDLASYPCLAEHMIGKRRKTVPVEERTTTNWWAPLKKMGEILKENPFLEEDENELEMAERYREQQSGHMSKYGVDTGDISFDEDDWSESIHI